MPLDALRMASSKIQSSLSNKSPEATSAAATPKNMRYESYQSHFPVSQYFGMEKKICESCVEPKALIEEIEAHIEKLRSLGYEVCFNTSAPPCDCVRTLRPKLKCPIHNTELNNWNTCSQCKSYNA